MPLFTFNVAFYEFDDWTNAADNNSVEYNVGRTLSLDANASPIVIQVEDDDGVDANGAPIKVFHDGYIDILPNGSTATTATNNQLLKNAITINGTTYPVGAQVELEFASEVTNSITTANDIIWIIRINGQNVGITGPTLPTPGAQYTVVKNFDGQEVPYDDIPCFTTSTKISTMQGEIAIENLKVGDEISLHQAENKSARIKWIGRRKITQERLLDNPKLYPIRICKGALGKGLPHRDLLVSRQHRMLVSSPVAMRMFGINDVLIPAIKLTEMPDIYIDTSVEEVEYMHILFDTHEVIYAEGAPTESLLTGPQALKSMSKEAIEEIKAIFPEVFEEGFEASPARYIPEGPRQKKLIHRLVKNKKPAVA